MLETTGAESGLIDARFAVEFQQLSRYLTGLAASDYQISKYMRFRQLNSLAPARRFDRFLDAAAAWGPPGLMLADTYSGTFCRASPIQRKLMAAVAILECSPPSFEIFDTPRGGARWAHLRLLIASFSGLLALAVSALLFAPAHFFAWIADRVSR
jgi:hypothetical protein